MKTDKIELYLEGSYHPFVTADSSFQPNDGDLINIHKVTYEVIGRSFTVDHVNKEEQQVRCNVILRRERK